MEITYKVQTLFKTRKQQHDGWKKIPLITWNKKQHTHWRKRFSQLLLLKSCVLILFRLIKNTCSIILLRPRKVDFLFSVKWWKTQCTIHFVHFHYKVDVRGAFLLDLTTSAQWFCLFHLRIFFLTITHAEDRHIYA